MLCTIPKYLNSYYNRGLDVHSTRVAGVALDSTLIHCTYETVESPAAPNMKSYDPIDDQIPRKVIAPSSDRRSIFITLTPSHTSL
jgi:hypothetical protein